LAVVAVVVIRLVEVEVLAGLELAQGYL